MNIQEFAQYHPTCKTFALIGKPLKHSVSAGLHSIVYETEKIDAVYLCVEVEECELETFILLAKEKLYGFNVTIPYKEKIIPYLSELEADATNIGAVNTVKVERDGRLIGYNTDIRGAKETFRDKGIALEGKNAVLLGAGGAARTIACVLSSGCASITVVGRERSKAEAFIESLNLPDKKVFKAADYDSLDLRQADILVNATPAGMTGYPPMTDINLKNAPKLSFVFDTIYNPLRTQLLKKAAGRQLKYENGLYMLIEQGIAADEIWLSEKIGAETVKRVRSRLAGNVATNRLSAVRGRKNILLSGFMGCGKTTVGKVLAKRMGFELYDIDKRIEAEAGMSVKEIFERYGESYFRELETEHLRRIGGMEGLVVASGGGAMVNRKNFEIASESCLILYLKADFEFMFNNISKAKTRPLLMTEDPKGTAFKLFMERKPFYEANMDFSVRANLDVNRVVRNIIYSI